MGERTDDLGDFDRSPLNAVPPDDELDETLYTGRHDLGDTEGPPSDEIVDVTDRDAELAGAPHDETVDVKDRYERLAARANRANSERDPTVSAASYDADELADDLSGAGNTDDASDASDASDDPNQIRGDIEETRTEMSQTIDEIQERLSPRRLAQQATDTVREATIGKAEQVMSDARDTAQNAGQSLWRTIRENPIPAALAGLGLGWLLYKTWDNMPSSDSRSGGYPRYQDRFGNHYDGYDGYGGAMYRSPGYGATSDEEDEGPGMTDRVQQKASEMSDQLSDTAQQWADQAQYQARRAQGWLQRSWDQNPLVMGALALAAGAVAGLAIPETEPENQLMGPARDSFIDKAQDTAQKAQVVAKRAASAAADAAQDEASKQGLTQKS